MTSEFDVSHLPAEEAAAHLLVTPSALADLSLADAARVVAYMKPKRFKAGTIVIQEGEARHNDYMLLLLSGDIAVENELPGAADSMVVSIIGPGSLLGEMGVIDGSPRSATCTANTDITVGLLTRTGLMRLLRDEPAVGARLLLAITKRMADRLRETTRKLRTFAQMNRVLQQELNVVMNNRIRTERQSAKS
ncbi:cyclic nucleotide-binding domain-containing protein [uncultured Hydrogenophaga sp.]|uniref:cyclic nucleotide-binding domain-containing protein n=1 Tax=uncultured Hydrogenophaga sp. TaxID=199683 RepID=UPI00265EFBEA|nr:cyclic nucleotide-binding domain-containing protein [uncultured Hydrogenophaga sp.]